MPPSFFYFKHLACHIITLAHKATNEGFDAQN